MKELPIHDFEIGDLAGTVSVNDGEVIVEDNTGGLLRELITEILEDNDGTVPKITAVEVEGGGHGLASTPIPPEDELFLPVLADILPSPYHVKPGNFPHDNNDTR